MAWTPLKENYTDAVWSGLKKYTQIDNSDGTVSFQDVTVYTNKENSFFGAYLVNQGFAKGCGCYDHGIFAVQYRIDGLELVLAEFLYSKLPHGGLYGFT